MRLLLDECLPRRLGRELSPHDVRTVQDMSWSGTKNGPLLRLAAEAGFDVFVTIDRGLEFQHHVRSLALAVVALRAPSSDISDLRPLVPDLLSVLPDVRPGTLTRVPAS